jgi:hypothetical protein
MIRVLAPIALLSCGGGGKKPATPKNPPAGDVKPLPPPETDADREKRRHAEALAIVPDGSPCLPPELKNTTAPRLELGVIEGGAIVCAFDQERTRLLGPVACWKVELGGATPGTLTYQPAAPLPGRGLAVMFDDRCARGYCLPKDAKVPSDPVALMAWNLDGSKVAVLSGENVHIFDAASKAHETSFSIRGDKGVTGDPSALHWNGDAIFIEAGDVNSSGVWVFKPDGIPVGPIEALGGKDKALLSTRNGSFVLLDPKQVAISEQGFSALTIYEIESGKRTKVVRKLPASACKKDELDALWKDASATVSPKCKDYVAKNYAHLIGADAVKGSRNFLALLRGPRLGELAVLDVKTLAELKTFKMPWCEAGGGVTGSGGGKATASDKTSVAPAAEPAPARAAKKASAPKGKGDKADKDKGDDAEDPDSGGQ